MNNRRDNSEQQLYLHQKLDVIGQLAGGISHNFNNQLTGIMGFANLISMRSTDPNIKKFAEEILGICRVSGDMIRELLTFARYKPVTADGVDVNDVITTITHLLLNSIDKRIDIRNDLCAQHCTVMADAVQLQSALLNLALNSKDAMPSGGIITFTTKTADVSRGDTAEKFVRVEVSDTGCGFSDEAMAHLFEPFFTTKGQGRVGLGLSAVYRFVQGMNGTIRVDSVEGKGASVVLTLPRRVDAGGHDVANSNVPNSNIPNSNIPNSNSIDGNANNKNGVRGTILLVDDDKSTRESVSAYLRNIGYSVFTAIDGLDAVEKYSGTHAAIDLVIMDMVMPRMDGRDAFLQMREVNPNIKAICITGFNKHSAGELTNIGIKRVLHKPFPFDELKNVVAEYI